MVAPKMSLLRSFDLDITLCATKMSRLWRCRVICYILYTSGFCNDLSPSPFPPRGGRGEVIGNLVLLLPPMFPGAQTPVPVIKAKSGTVDIRDGNELKKKAWTNNPDVFRAKPVYKIQECRERSVHRLQVFHRIRGKL